MKKILLTAWLIFAFCASGMAQTQAAADEYAEIIVNFEDQATAESIQKIADVYGIALTYNSEFSKQEALMRFSVPEGKTADALVQFMQQLTDEQLIEYAEPNYLYEAYGKPNDPMYDKQWNMQMIKIEDAWRRAEGKGAVVAVIDTGVAFEDYSDKQGEYHRVPDLAQTAFVKGYDFVDDDEHPNDENSHGTHVAGTIAQSTNNSLGVVGVAPKAAIMPLRVLNKYGYGNIADIAEAITFAADHGANVINMSLGGPSESKLMREAVEYAHKKGVTIICAAGNERRGRASYPAAYPYAIGVSSVGPTGSLAPYSNYGEGVDIAAPGGDTSSNREHGVLQNTIGRSNPKTDGYEYFQGTSMASPHVAGVAALIVSSGVKDPAKVEKILFETATKKNDASKFGAGIVNAAAAVNASAGEPTCAAVNSAETATFKIKESLLYFLAGVGFAIYYFKLAKRSDGYGPIFSFLFSLAMFLTSSGLFFVELLDIPFVSPSVLHIISAPLPHLDQALFGSFATILNPLLHSALIPVLLVVLFHHTKFFKAVAIGVAVGMAAHLAVDTLFSLANVSFIPGTFLLDKAWLLLNAAVCFVMAVLTGKSS